MWMVDVHVKEFEGIPHTDFHFRLNLLSIIFRLFFYFKLQTQTQAYTSSSIGKKNSGIQVSGYTNTNKNSDTLMFHSTGKRLVIHMDFKYSSSVAKVHFRLPVTSTNVASVPLHSCMSITASVTQSLFTWKPSTMNVLCAKPILLELMSLKATAWICTWISRSG